MENNTQLPVEVVNEINEQADKYGFVVPYDGSNKFYNDDKVEGYKAGATAYASKLQELKAEFDNEMQKNYETIVAERAANHLTPGAPTTTGTYFAVLKPFVGDRDEMVVIHYQADKGVYYAYGQFSRPIKAEDIIGYIPREQHSKLQPGIGWVKASAFKYVTGSPYHAKDNLSKGAGKFDVYGQFVWGDGSITLPSDWDDLLILDEQPAAGREDAVEFAEWIRKIYQPDEHGYWIDHAGNQYTTADRYTIFKQQKGNNG